MEAVIKIVRRKWTEPELDVIRDIWRSGIPVKACMHLLPGRTCGAVKEKARELELPKKSRKYSPTWEVLKHLMKDGKPLTALQASKLTGICAEQIRSLVSEHVNDGSAHIVDWVRATRRGHLQAYFLPIPGESKPKPQKLTPREMQQRYRDKFDPEDWHARQRKYVNRRYLKRGKLIRREPLLAAFFGSAG
ncbi:hypothetical protein [Cupriavidus basilensis]|uniref:hypothetical protein n=1 Tax=Cupriavidus basilensis TaxID=68895 RepID=UPI0005BD5BE3|nr:hypothetical protein [Cupriavidus basilensis]